MIPAIWTFAIMYSLGALLYLTILEATEETDPHSDVKLALLWPYVAVRVLIERLIYGSMDDEDGTK
tara:strand:- start:59 stop:256 length:198 start_codon:yes stop_codon:yes gene_type:complete